MGVELQDAESGIAGASTSITGTVAVWSPPSMTARARDARTPRSPWRRGELLARGTVAELAVAEVGERQVLEVAVENGE